MSEGHGMQPSGVWALKPLADMSQTDFRDWQALLEDRTGMVISEQRRAFLQTNLTARMRELGVNDYASYFRQVTDGPRGAVEWATLLDRLTVQETRFFRHRPRHGNWVRDELAARCVRTGLFDGMCGLTDARGQA